MSNKTKKTLNLYEISLFAMFGALMFISKMVLDFLPNIHLTGVFIAVFTLTYRAKALIPIYVYVLLVGLFYGFNAWWIPYLYIWTILWAAIMLIPRKLQKRTAAIISHVLCIVHGLAFGTLWAPAQAVLFNLSFSSTIKWIIAGFPYDLIHSGGNLVAGLLIYPLTNLIEKLKKRHG